MTTSDTSGRGYGTAALALTLGLALLPVGGLCGAEPEPLRNRETKPAPVEVGEPALGGGVVVPGGSSATGQGGSQATTVVVTPGGVVSPAEPGGVAVPTTPGDRGGKDVLVPGGTVKPGDEGGGVPFVPVVPGGVATPGDKDGLVPVVPSKPGPADGKGVVPGAANALGVGGDQSTKVLVTPPVGVAPVVPDKAGNVSGRPETDAAAGKAVPVPAVPIEVPADGKVFDNTGRPVAMPPGQEVVLPNGGKIIDGRGATVAVPPGARVLVPFRPMTPGDFLPKTGKPSNKPAPGEPPKGQSQARPKAGDPFQIAEEACQKHTVSFLEGCWRSAIRLSDGTNMMMRFCFDANGKGKRTDTYKRDGSHCDTPTEARWEKNVLSFSFGQFHCSNRPGGRDVPIVCTGCGNTTKCIGTEYSGKTGKMTGKTHFEIARE